MSTHGRKPTCGRLLEISSSGGKIPKDGEIQIDHGAIKRLGRIVILATVEFLVNVAPSENPDQGVHAFHHSFHVFHIGGGDLNESVGLWQERDEQKQFIQNLLVISIGILPRLRPQYLGGAG